MWVRSTCPESIKTAASTPYGILLTCLVLIILIFNHILFTLTRSTLQSTQTNKQSINMQLQKFLALSGIVLLGNVVGTLADLEPDEVPQQCKQVCNSIVERSDHCDRTTHDDHAEKECMCKLENASTVVPQCEACVAKFHSEVSDHSDPHDNGMLKPSLIPHLTSSSLLTLVPDVYDIIKFCHFTTTSYNGGAMAETSTGSSMPSATSAAGSSPTAAATTSAAGSPAPTSSSGGGAGGGGVIPSAPTMAPSSSKKHIPVHYNPWCTAKLTVS